MARCHLNLWSTIDPAPSNQACPNSFSRSTRNVVGGICLPSKTLMLVMRVSGLNHARAFVVMISADWQSSLCLRNCRFCAGRRFKWVSGIFSWFSLAHSTSYGMLSLGYCFPALIHFFSIKEGTLSKSRMLQSIRRSVDVWPGLDNSRTRCAYGTSVGNFKKKMSADKYQRRSLKKKNVTSWVRTQ